MKDENFLVFAWNMPVEMWFLTGKGGFFVSRWFNQQGNIFVWVQQLLFFTKGKI
ncbi:MAG TPA: hypothetical protein PK530_00325 [Anaerolineales bacterium]|nr:hypothetical protein [Anaerolineales bacterium]